jgi:hypothetical protein
MKTIKSLDEIYLMVFFINQFQHEPVGILVTRLIIDCHHIDYVFRWRLLINIIRNLRLSILRFRNFEYLMVSCLLSTRVLLAGKLYWCLGIRLSSYKWFHLTIICVLILHILWYVIIISRMIILVWSIFCFLNCARNNLPFVLVTLDNFCFLDCARNNFRFFIIIWFISLKPRLEILNGLSIFWILFVFAINCETNLGFNVLNWWDTQFFKGTQVPGQMVAYFHTQPDTIRITVLCIIKSLEFLSNFINTKYNK